MQGAIFMLKKGGRMTNTELENKLKEHLEFLEQVADEAKDAGFYGDVAELSKRITTTILLISQIK